MAAAPATAKSIPLETEIFPLTLRPFGIHSVLALLVLIFAVLMMFSVVPFGALEVGALLAVLTLAALF